MMYYTIAYHTITYNITLVSCPRFPVAAQSAGVCESSKECATLCTIICVYVCMYVCIYIYIYIHT